MDSVKRIAVVLAILVAGFVTAASASATTTIIEPPGSHFPYQRWVDEAKVPTPAGSIPVIESTLECGVPDLGCTDGATIWVDMVGGKATFLHELGHVFAFQHPELAAFENERFADSYSLCARLHRIAPAWNYLNDGGIRGSRLRKICRLIRAH
jgi:hypothetical protein